MRTFNHLRDAHFPNGYPDWILQAIENLVEWYVKRTSERFDISTMKTILDVGSLNGIESVKFTEKIPGCQVYTFEPNPISLNTVNISTAGIENIHIEPIAASNYNGKSKFFITPGNMGASSILPPISLPHKLGNVVNETTVDVVRLDDWCKSKNIESVDMMWIDAQGSEYAIFEGMGELLKNVKSIYVEGSMIPYYQGARHINDVIELLRKYNFDLVSETRHDEYEGDFMFLKNIGQPQEISQYKNPQGIDYIQK